MCGYPAIAAGEEQPPESESPFTGSISQAGPEVIVTMASSLCLASTASMPLLRVALSHTARASR